MDVLRGAVRASSPGLHGGRDERSGGVCERVTNGGVDDSDIAGGTDTTYTPVTADGTKTIKVRVSFTGDAGNAAFLTSAATAAVVLGGLKRVLNI